jgi:hypothetical protein
MHSNLRRLTAHRVGTRAGIQSFERTKVGRDSPVVSVMATTRNAREGGAWPSAEFSETERAMMQTTL